jgi:hypothetical protein
MTDEFQFVFGVSYHGQSSLRITDDLSCLTFG